MQKEQADYLLALGRKYGWGLEINEVIRSLLAAEVIAYQRGDKPLKDPPP